MTATRLSALDGLRGVAAAIVLVHHALLVVPGLAAPYYGQYVEGGAVGLLVNTPLHIVWAGTEAVYLFFVLSGLVLAFATRSRSFSWASYFPSRIARLYLPVIGAVLLGALVIAFTPSAGPDDSLWIQGHPQGAYDLPGVLRDITLIGGVSGWISPLWSLQWEVLFSLMLPLYVDLARRLSPWILLPVFIALATIGQWTGVATLKYLPMFGIGMAMAALWEPLTAAVARTSRRTAAIVVVPALLIAVVMVTSFWTLRGILPAEVLGVATLPIILLGIILVIVLAAHSPMLSGILSSAPFRFLGVISFSLYLVHEPIVIAVTQFVGRPVLGVIVGIPIAAAVSVLFWWAVERPSHRVARRIRSGISDDGRLGVLHTAIAAPRLPRASVSLATGSPHTVDRESSEEAARV